MPAHSGQCLSPCRAIASNMRGKKRPSTRPEAGFASKKGTPQGSEFKPLEFLGELGTEFARPAKFSRFGQNCGVIITAAVIKFVA